jgi:copper chaperone CopZ
MKKLFITILSFALAFQLHAQFKTASLTASGLTCAMCTRAIFSSLEKIPFVESVKPDIKNSAFNITFRKNAAVDFDRLKKAVEDAGFSVASLNVTVDFSNTVIKNDTHIKIGDFQYHFIKVSPQTLNGEKTVRIIDKDFVPAKEHKKYVASSAMKCVETGKSAACCLNGHAPDERVYHITI